jgi:hypothetical protein
MAAPMHNMSANGTISSFRRSPSFSIRSTITAPCSTSLGIMGTGPDTPAA